ncbi:MAG: 30S ribosomal protein S9 [Bacillota bacterium]|nr:30S ribosomal protein S9 [Bacillota bacterium]
MAKQEKKFYGTGRRKSSVARVFLKAGSGKITVNGREVSEYFPYATLVMNLKQPLTILGVDGKYDVEATANGGGFTGQAEAVRLGIARALLEAGEDRKSLKVAGMLTRNARSKERKKYGLKAARRAPQFSKR